MGDVAGLLTGLDRHLMTVVLAGFTLLLEVFVPYRQYASYLKWLAFSLLAYALVLVFIHVPWREVALRSLLPHFRLDGAAATVIVGVFGTTISPYLFFWQSSEEVEDMRQAGATSLIADPARAPSELRRIKWDTWSGMFYSDISAWFIILATALTLHVAGVTDIQTAAQAASALKPLAGDLAFLLFAVGILGVGLIGVPVLAGSAGFALSEAMGWKWGLEVKARDARGFYGVIAAATLVGVALDFSPINPIKALFWSAVINGVVAVPLVVVVVLLASRKSVMGAFTASPTLVVLGWITAAVMALAALGMLIPS
jgi:Mn2+/Fe2+ NRAMP family transporter